MILEVSQKRQPKGVGAAFSAFVLFATFFISEVVLACPTCIGDAGKDRAALLTSMMVLFVITVGMLAAFGAFFFYVQRRSIIYNSSLNSSDCEKPADTL